MNIRGKLKILCFLTAALALHGATLLAEERNETKEIFVRGDDTPCPEAGFDSIQEAINSAQTGDTVHVCQGGYTEQLVIKKSLRLIAEPGATLMPHHMVKNAVSLSTAESLSAAILVSDADNVEVRGFTIEGTRNEIGGCAPRLVGILYQNASGSVVDNSIRDMQLEEPFTNCQSGTAIEIQSDASGHSEVDIHDNAVDGYQMNAITGNGPHTYVGIDENEIMTQRPKEVMISRNGIQIGFGARGVIENNTIARDLTPGATPQGCAPNGVGILVFDSDEVFVVTNSIESMGVGILVQGNRTRISGNNFSACSAHHAIAVFGDGNEVSSNELPGTGEAVMFVRGKRNRIAKNQFSGDSSGVLELDTISDNFLSDNALCAVRMPTSEISSTLAGKAMPSK
jgi:nitrous oxidase accessory protein NosD